MGTSLFPIMLLPFVSVGATVWVLSHQTGWAFLAGGVASSVSALLHLLTQKRTKELLEGLASVSSRAAKGFLEPSREVRHFNQVASVFQELGTRSRELQSESETLEAVLDGMADGVWLTNQEGVIVRCNTALRNLLAWNKEIEGHKPIVVLRSLELQTAVQQACTEGMSTEVQVTVEGKTLSARIFPLGKGRRGSSAVFHDITALRQLETMRRDFVANVSHELGTPITAILGFAETLKEGALSDADNAPHMVGIIYRQAQRLSALVRDLLELSRLESRLLPIEKVEVALAPAIERTVETLAPKALAKNLKLFCELEKELTAKADPRGIEHVVMNLIDNAIKYTPEGGQIWVRTIGKKECCTIEVKDTGLGIEAKHLPRLFERFYRVDVGRSRDIGGTGLGLAIVKHWMTAMEGDVRVESQPNLGSTFVLTLPSFSEKTGELE